MLPRISDDKTAVICHFGGQDVEVIYTRTALKSLGMKHWQDGAALGPVIAKLDQSFEETEKLILLGLPGRTAEEVSEWTGDWTNAHFTAFLEAFCAQWGIDLKAMTAGSGENSAPPPLVN